MDMYKNELYFAIGAVVSSILIVWQSFTYSISSSLFPRFISLLLLILSFILLIKSWKFYLKKEQEKKSIGHSSVSWAAIVKNPIFVLFILMFLYVYGITYLGYFISTVLFIGVTMFLLGQGRRNLLFVIFIAILFTVLLFCVFSKLLNVPLPT